MTRSRFEHAISSFRRQGIKYDLDRMFALADQMGHPERSYLTLHVTGTNGKGSTSAFLASILQAAGYRVGLNTSPHLVSYRERIRVNGRALDDEQLHEWFDALRPLFDEVDASFFEATTALAFHAFRETNVDIAVMEVGLGGRLDASNVIQPVGSVITNVDLEHTRILGDTVEAIAREKGGIIKRHPVVSAVHQPGARDVLVDLAERQEAPLTFVTEGSDWRYAEHQLHMGDFVASPGLVGRHQAENAALAVTLLRQLRDQGTLDVSDDALVRGVEATTWPGRIDRRTLPEGEVVFDVAHNGSGARVLEDYLRSHDMSPLPTVVGMLKDKAHVPFLEALRPVVSSLVVTTPGSETRALASDELATVARELGYDRVESVPDPATAIRTARAKGSPVLVTGSLFTVGSAMQGIGLCPADEVLGFLPRVGEQST